MYRKIVDYIIASGTGKPSLVVAWCRRRDIPTAPVGAANEKTALPGTYRRVGASCPSSCPYLNNGCFAQGGNVAMHHKRDTGSIEAAINAAAIAMGVSSGSGDPARIHVSGDFYRDDKIDSAYIDALCAVADYVREVRNAPGMIVGFGYTHAPEADFEPHRLQLASSGIKIRYSDKAGKGGAIVAPHDSLKALRKEVGPVIACPAQLRDDITCKSCRLCWEVDTCVAFDPHGSGAKKAKEASPLTSH